MKGPSIGFTAALSAKSLTERVPSNAFRQSSTRRYRVLGGMTETVLSARAGKAAVADADAAQVSARAQKAIQAHRAETEGAQAGRGHADKAQQARHSQASHAADDADSGVAKPVVPHAAQGKATEAAAHASAHPHQEVGSHKYAQHKLSS